MPELHPHRVRGRQLLRELRARPVAGQGQAHAQAQRAAELEVDSTTILQDLVLQAHASPSDYLDEDGNFSIEGLSRDCMSALEMTVAADGATTYKLSQLAKLKASEMLAKHTGLFEEDNRQKKPGPIMTEEEAQIRLREVLGGMKRPPIDLDQYEDAELVDRDESGDVLP